MTTKDSEPQPEPAVNALNEFLVAYSGSRLGGAYVTPRIYPMLRTKQQAYRLAAWCATMGEQLPDETGAHTFEQIRDAVRNS